ncbi:hypothetical protein [Stenotrophomonas riyadhensis]|uniref:hypothetical protein n=1 Tax=Stenotrophomonas riyadhensis TaxID=2859893 RepID=UPI003306394D
MSDDQQVDLEKQLLAAALFNLRVLLAGHLGPEEQSLASDAAWLAYSLHPQALLALEGKTFDVAQVLHAVERLEPRYVRRFRHEVLRKEQHFIQAEAAPLLGLIVCGERPLPAAR